MSDLREAAKLALIALENGTSPNLWSSTKENLRKALAMEKFSKVNQEIEEALKQPQQEPVAWVYNGILHEFDPSEFATSEVKPLYTAPPKREWVGVTYDEVYEFVCTADSYINLAKAIEAKLKEKNT